MPRARPLLQFLGAFGLVYGLLIAPWPSWAARYGAFFRAGAAACLAHERPDSVVRFRAAPAGARLDTQIVLADPRQADGQGHARGTVLGLDTRGVGWVPTAFLIALVLATPVPWRRRWAALGLGLMALHAYLLLAVRVYIWNRSLPAPVPGAAVPVVKWIAAALEETMVTQLGPSFVVPAVIWILVAFRREDFTAARAWLGWDEAGAQAGPTR